jgi:hypothetical protein
VTTRRPPALPDGVALWCVSDTHHEIPAVNYPQHRAPVVASDMRHLPGRIDAWCHLGDATTYATPGAHGAALDWWRAMVPTGAPQALVPGNHDLLGMRAGGQPDLFTPEQWALTWGAPAPWYVVDVAGLRLVCVSPTAAMVPDRLTLDAGVLAWLDEALTTELDCVILHHAPLRGSVNPAPAVPGWSSDDPVIYVHDDPPGALGDVLAAHPNARAWASGHTHSPVGTPGMVTPMTFGATRLAAISVSSPVADRPVSAHITVAPDRIDVRYRDHGARQWLAPVHSVTRQEDLA